MFSNFIKWVSRLTVVPLVAFLFIGCDGENVDDELEASCSTATGLWTVQSSSCNEVSNEDENLIYFLFDGTRVEQTSGITSCASTFSWDIEVGESVPTFDMTGSGSLSCSANGEEVNSCSSGTSTCNALIDITGIVNNFSTCVITGTTMTMSRQVSTVNNPDNLSSCVDGEEEVLTLVKATNIDLDPTPTPDEEDPRAILRVAGPNPSDYGSLSVGSDRSLTLTITNFGNTEATMMNETGLNPPFEFKGGAYPGTGGSCTVSLVASGNCSLVVEFSPQSVGVFADTILLNYNDRVDQQTLSHGLIGSGSNTLGLLIISDGPFYDFGSVLVNNVSTHVFTVTNTGGGAATALQALALSDPFSFTGGVYPGTAGTCGATLAAASSCDIEVQFLPTTESPFNGVIQMDYHDGFFPQSSTRNIFGVGVP